MNSKSKLVFIFLAAVLLTVFFAAAVSAQDKNSDKEKLYTEITGDYEFEAGDQVVVISFSLEDGVLTALQEGDDELVELEPVEDEELEFTAVTEDGREFEVNFKRDDEGKITTCIIIGDGEEIEGTKISDGK
ncbi:MAG: hypothetical protein GY863_04570 [bacterium]|nr:hypothetical protein [bacterium]